MKAFYHFFLQELVKFNVLLVMSERNMSVCADCVITRFLSHLCLLGIKRQRL